MSTIAAMSQLSRDVDALECTVADPKFVTISQASPLALSNLLARLRRLEQTITDAARQ